MVLKIFAVLVIFQYASSIPDPNVNLNINVNVEDNDGCNDCTKCLFEDKTYKHGDYIENICLVLQCIRGNWIFTARSNSDCGLCKVYGDPHFNVFDNHIMSKSNYITIANSSFYDFQGNGSYVISQHGLNYPSIYGINSTFEDCGDEGSCITSASYYEPGIAINITIPAQIPDECSGIISNDSCNLMVYVNGYEQNIDKSVKSYDGEDGAVLVFYYNYEDIFEHVRCINIIGSKGLSVSLCSYGWTYSFLNVWAKQSLQSIESQLFGLCGTFTGITQDGYMMQNGSRTNIINEFAESWKGEGVIKPITHLYTDVGRCNGTFNGDSDNIQEQCIRLISTYIIWNITNQNEVGSNILSCMFDLCRVEDRWVYAQGYNVDLAINRLLESGPCSPFPSCCTNHPSAC